MATGRVVIGIVALGAICACSTEGAYMKPERAQELEQSITTAEELEKALGIPTVTVPLEDGRTLWVYQGIYKQANAASYIPYVGLVAGGNNKKCTRLSVQVDREGKLSHWNYSSGTGKEYWAKLNDKCDWPDEANGAPRQEK